jgi:TonB family protein
MPQRCPRTLALLLLLCLPALSCRAAEDAPPDNARRANPAWLFNPRERCPDLRVADDENSVVVVFKVSASGTPSRASIRSSSASAELDQAALSCVMKLRYAPATQLGDATAIASWQQLGFQWAKPAQHGAAPVAAGSAPAAGAAVAATAVAVTGAAAAAPAPSGNTPDGSVRVQLCADENGRLVREPAIIGSSGDPQIDAAALKVARAGSGAYRPVTQLQGRPLSGCVELDLRFQTR